MVKTPPFQCRGHRFNPRSGNKDATCLAARSKTNFLKNTRTNFGNKEMPNLPEQLQYEIRMTLLQRQTQSNGKSRELGTGLASMGMQRVSTCWKEKNRQMHDANIAGRSHAKYKKQSPPSHTRTKAAHAED